MTYEFEPDRMYRMPTHFGPSLGPRQGPMATKEAWREFTTTHVAVTFTTDAEALEGLLPPRFTLREPRVDVNFEYYERVAWLAGRGYNVLGVSTPVRFDGDEDHEDGSLLLVLWENMPEPIMTGREELGYPKLYCEIPPARWIADTVAAQASWWGHTFARLWARDLSEAVPDPEKEQCPLLHVKYVPRTEKWGEADAHYVTSSPPDSDAPYVEDLRLKGGGELELLGATWEQMPTQYTIVNALAALPRRDIGPVEVVRSHGSWDLSNQRILR